MVLEVFLNFGKEFSSRGRLVILGLTSRWSMEEQSFHEY